MRIIKKNIIIVLHILILACDSNINNGVDVLSYSNDTVFVRLEKKYWIYGSLVQKDDTNKCFVIKEMNVPNGKFIIFINEFRVSSVLSFDVDSVPYYIVDSLELYGFNVEFDTSDIPRFVYISVREDSLVCYFEQSMDILLCEQIEITLSRMPLAWKRELYKNATSIIRRCGGDIDFNKGRVVVELMPLGRIDSIVGSHDVIYNYNWKSEIMFIRLIYKNSILWRIEVLPLYALK